MGPLRIVILLFLFYILYRLVAPAAGKNNKGAGKRQRDSDVRDILEEDPVCHVYIPRRQAITLKKGAETVYFCSHACRQHFLDATREK